MTMLMCSARMFLSFLLLYSLEQELTLSLSLLLSLSFSGTQNQKVRFASARDGRELNSVRHHTGLILGQRIGPVSSLAFHPYRLILAAGATDSIISMYQPTS